MDYASEDIKNFAAGRLRVNKLVLKVVSWVASAVARRVELWEDTTLVLPPAPAVHLVLSPALAARAAVLAIGDELLDCVLPDESVENSGRGGSRAGVVSRLSTLPAAARRGRAAPGAAAVGRRRQEGAPRPEQPSIRLNFVSVDLSHPARRQAHQVGGLGPRAPCTVADMRNMLMVAGPSS